MTISISVQFALSSPENVDKLVTSLPEGYRLFDSGRWVVAFVGENMDELVSIDGDHERELIDRLAQEMELAGHFGVSVWSPVSDCILQIAADGLDLVISKDLGRVGEIRNESWWLEQNDRLMREAKMLVEHANIEYTALESEVD